MIQLDLILYPFYNSDKFKAKLNLFDLLFHDFLPIFSNDMTLKPSYWESINGSNWM